MNRHVRNKAVLFPVESELSRGHLIGSSEARQRIQISRRSSGGRFKSNEGGLLGFSISVGVLAAVLTMADLGSIRQLVGFTKEDSM